MGTINCCQSTEEVGNIDMPAPSESNEEPQVQDGRSSPGHRDKSGKNPETNPRR